jgi:hypothetical protein
MTATVLAFPTPAPKDGGKARILRRRADIGLGQNFGRVVGYDHRANDLTQRHADPEDTAPCEYSAPPFDGA